MKMLQNSDQPLMSHTDSDAHGTRVVSPGQCHCGSRTLPEYISQSHEGTSPNRCRWDKACADARWSATRQWWLVCSHSTHKRIMHLLLFTKACWWFVVKALYINTPTTSHMVFHMTACSLSCQDLTGQPPLKNLKLGRCHSG
jgi:hypothetical protein